MQRQGEDTTQNMSHNLYNEWDERLLSAEGLDGVGQKGGSISLLRVSKKPHPEE
ncbi:hypothetical protein LCGC14_1202720 [marine sediment metagenome]|uniref:Uncharacterized protein n=1 Tax=marine sediment metagenome TaxID=412755 RepID=A0A0F9M3Q5_9ZZZZ